MNTPIPNNTELQEGEMFTFHFGPDEIRGIVRNEEPLILAKDLCDVLEHANSRKAVEGIPEDELVSLKVTSGGQIREMNFLSEPGMYRLLFRSNKPKAEPFVRWVTREVLPSIRREGRYELETREKALTGQLVDLQGELIGTQRLVMDERRTRDRAEAERLRLRKKAHTPLSSSELQQIVGLKKAGVFTRDIAVHLERGESTVRRIWLDYRRKYNFTDLIGSWPEGYRSLQEFLDSDDEDDAEVGV